MVTERPMMAKGLTRSCMLVKQPDLALSMHLRGRRSDNGASPICLVYSGRCCCSCMVFKGSPDPCLY